MVGTFSEWLDDQPESVRRLAEEFPPCEIFLNETKYWVIGYSENDELIVSDVPPGEGEAKQQARRAYVPAEQLRGHTRRVN